MNPTIQANDISSNQEHERLGASELTVALTKVKADLASGRYREDSVENHLNRIANA